MYLHITPAEIGEYLLAALQAQGIVVDPKSIRPKSTGCYEDVEFDGYVVEIVLDPKKQ